MNTVLQSFEQTLLTAPELVCGLADIPSSPKVLPRLQHLVDDPNSSIQDIVALIRVDPGLVARVLRLANRFCQSRADCVHSVEEAVARVGYGTVCENIPSFGSSLASRGSLLVYGVDADRLWREALSCALAAETLASCVGEDPEIAYTIGLLHGVGMVAINDWALKHQPVLVFTHRGFPREFNESERALLGITQAEAGAALLESWGIPPVLSGPIRWQYTPHSSAVHARMAALLHAAKWVRSVVCDDEPGSPSFPDSFAIQPLRLPRHRIESLVGEVSLRMLALRHLLGIC